MITIKRFVVNFVQVNCYIVSDETNECIIIDGGCFGKNEESELTAYIENNHLKVKHLLNTHLHFDHILGNAFLSDFYHLKPQANRADEFLLKSLKEQLLMFGCPYEVTPQAIENFIDESDIIHFGNTELKILHVPGHSPGSLCFYCEKEKILFSGDVLFQCSIGRTDLPQGDYKQLCEGIQNKLFSLPEDVVVYPGHGPQTTIGNEIKYNPYV